MFEYIQKLFVQVTSVRLKKSLRNIGRRSVSGQAVEFLEDRILLSSVSAGILSAAAQQSDVKVVSVPLKNLTGSATQAIDITFTLSAGRSSFRELGIYAMDDSTGRVNGVRPDADGFSAAVMESPSRKVLFINGDPTASTHTLRFAANAKLAVYVIGMPGIPMRAGADHLRVVASGTNGARISWEQYTAVWPGLGQQQFDDALIVLNHTDPIAVNSAPDIRTIGNKPIDEQQRFTLPVRVDDSDLPNDLLLYSLIAAPSGAGIDASTGVFTWTPTEAQGPGVFNVTVRVSDKLGLSDTESFQITVNEVNRPPVLAAIPAKTINEFSLLTFTATATDADLPKNTLTYSLVNAPSGATIHPTTGNFRWIPIEAQGGGVFNVGIRVSDGKGATDTKTVRITVNETNRPPVLAAIPAKTINELSLLTFTATATDPDLPKNTLTYSLVSPLAGATIHPTTGIFRWMPNEAQGAGVFNVGIRVSDGKGATDTKTVRITVNETNRPPVLAAIPAKTINEFSLLTFTATATDADLPKNTLTYSLVNAPSGATIHPTTGNFRWIPIEAQGGGVFNVGIRVSDGKGATDTKTVRITVNETNRPPVLAAIPAKTINELSLLTFTATATDPDLPKNTLTYSLVSPLAGATIHPTTGIFRWMPNEAQGAGVFNVGIRVSDGKGATDTKTVRITVNETNRPPVLAAIPAKTINEFSLLTFTATATDADLPKNTLTYSLVNAPSGATIHPTTGIFRWMPNDAQGAGVFNVGIRVSDGKGATDIKTVRITVNETNRPPVLAAIPAKTINELSLLTFTATATDPDLPKNTLTYSLVRPLAGATIHPTTGIFRWMPNEAQGAGVFNVGIRVSDGKGATDTKTVRITVNETNRPPVLAAIPAKTINELSLLTFTATATDPDLPKNTLTYSLVNAPAGATIHATTGVFRWTPTEGQGAGVFNVGIRVSDGKGATDTKTVRITVNEVNSAPSGILLSTSIISEQQPVGTSVGRFTTQDPDITQVPQTFTYALINGVGSTDNGKFTVDRNGNLKTADVFEFDTKNAFAIRVRSTDQGNRFVEKTFTVSVTSNGIVLQENSRFAAETLIPVILNPVTGQRVIRFTIDSAFDRTDTTSVGGDRLQVYLVDTDQTSRTLLDDGTPGTALFSLSESNSQFVTGLVRFDGTIVEIDASRIPGETSGRLLFQLLGGDTDSGTRITIGGISNQTNADVNAGSRVALADSPLSPGNALATSTLTATTNLKPLLSNSRFNSTSGEYTFDLQLQNIGNATGRKVAVTFPNLPSGVTLTNKSGTTASGVPYINFENAIPAGGMVPNGLSQLVTVKLSNPNNIRLSLRPQILVGAANRAPVFPAISARSVNPGQTHVIALNATDPDGDNVSYRLLNSQSLPTGTLRANGELVFTPQLNDLGQYSVEVVATDGVLETRRTIALNVVADPNTTTRISGVVLNTNNQPLAGVPVEIAGFSAVTGTDGSFIITLPTMKVPTEAFNISVPEGDAFLDPFNTGNQEIRFRRARHDVTTGDSVLNPRMHPNLVTSFIDASTVYGSDETRAAALRTFADGKLKTSTGNMLPLNNIATFPGGPLENDNEGRVDPALLFVSGDVRTNENVALIAMHTVFLREHNRLADAIKLSNPLLTDEQIYQKARHQVAAIIQHITYNEYLPLLLGAGAIPAYTGYKPSVDPRESELFATAAFRVGHTQLTSEIARLDASGNSLPGGPLTLKDAFFTADPIKNDGIEAYLRGLAATPMQEIDAHIIDDVRNFLFGPAGSGGMDLASMNIQRGRDVGLPSYNQARIDFGLSAVTDFNQITSNPTTQAALRTIYGSVEKIDVWVGGIAEDHASGAQIGPLFQAVLKDQFLRSRDGDRFYFENAQFTSSELAAIRGTTLESLMERNSPGLDLPSSPFTTGTQPAGPAVGGTAAGTTASSFRTIDGSGNSLSDSALGATGSHVIRNFTNGYADGISAPAGADRPGAREISNAVVAQSSSMPSSSGATSMLVFWGQILDHDLGLTPGGVSDTLKILGNQRPNPTGNEAYPFVAEPMELLLGHKTFPGVNNVIVRPVYLPLLDVANGTTIDPATNINVAQQIAPGETVSVFVEAGTLEDRQGNDFSGVLSITEVPRDVTPAALPSNLFPDTVVTIQPADMVFTTPAPVTFPNRGGWAPGTLMDLWSINPITGEFDDVGNMRVSADGSIIETITGGIRNSSWHFPTPPPIKPRPPKETKQNQDQQCNAGEATKPLTSTVELHSGAVRETHDLVTYQSLGNTRGLTLHYNSQQADPRPIVHFGFDDATSGRDGMLVARLAFFDGQFFHEVDGFEGGMGLPGGEHFWQLPEGTNDVHAALQADLRNLPTGLYTSRLSTGAMRLSEDGEFIGALADSFDQVVHVNSIDSAFGSGWELGGLQKVIQNADGSVLFLDGDGTTHVFRPILDEPGKFQSPPGDFTTFVKKANGTYERTFTDQTVSRFDSAGRLVSVTDRNGNATQYAYNSGRLTTITDPVGLVTTFTYTQNRVTSITDPTGRQTTLTYDSAGDLQRITDPDGATRTWGYDNQHHMTSEVDQLGRQEQTTYGFHGRATSAIRKDGSVVQVSPLQSQILLRPDATSSPELAPLADVVSARTASLAVDSNGNVDATVLDKAGQTIQSVDAFGNTGSIVRNDSNLVASSSNARGNQTKFSYDDDGNITELFDTVIDERGLSRAHFPNQPIDSSYFVWSTASGDLNGDAFPDLVFSKWAEDGITVVLGNGDGTFSTATTIPEESFTSVKLGDFNNDSILDLIIAYSAPNSLSINLSILTGQGDGTFANKQTIPINAAVRAWDFGDVNSDGFLDIVTVNYNHSITTILLGNGDGTFLQIEETQPGDVETGLIALGDVNGDSILDLMGLKSFSNRISVQLGNGDGTFKDELNVSVGDSTVDFAIGDINGDGSLDLVTSNSNSNDISVFRGTGDGNFSTQQRYSVTNQPGSIRLGDVNGDAVLDIVTQNSAPSFPSSDNISVLLGSGTGAFLPEQVYFIGGSGGYLQLADLDADDVLDVVSQQSDHGIVVLLATSDGRLNGEPRFRTGSAPTEIAAGDINSDGNVDLIITNYDSLDVSILLGLGNGTFATEQRVFSDSFISAVALGDVNGDGMLDLATLDDSDSVAIRLGAGNGTFSDARLFLIGYDPVALGFSDVNGDQILDLVTSTQTSEGISVLLGNGDGTFSAEQRVSTGDRSVSIALGDINGDGNIDIVAANYDSSDISVRLGNGDGTFLIESRFFTGFSPGSVALADIDGDGILDLFTENFDSNSISIRFGQGDGTFGTEQEVFVGIQPAAVAVVDLNHDDILDVAVPNLGFNSVSILLGSRQLSNSMARRYTYDPAFSQLTSTTDELGHQTVFEVDPANGNRLSATQVIGLPDSLANGENDDLVTTYTYTSRGLVDFMIDPLGRVTDYDYNSLGRLIMVTMAKGTPVQAVMQYEYDDAGNQTAVIDANNHRTEYEYDDMNRLVRVIAADPDGSGPLTSPITGLKYDARGNLIESTDPALHKVTNDYDVLDRLFSTTDGAGNETTFDYDFNGNVVSTTDPNGNTIRYRYDARNRRTASIDPDGGVTTFRYDSDDNLLFLTDPVGNRTQFAYDARNRLVREIDPLGKDIRYKYDAADNLIEKIDRNGRITRFTYDDVDRLVTEKWLEANGTTIANTITYAYDDVSNLLHIHDTFSELTYTYDERNRVRTVDNQGTPNVPRVVLTYTYDAVGNIASVTDTIAGAAGATTTYQYDGLNRNTSIQQSGTGVRSKTVDMKYNQLGQYSEISRYADLTHTQLVATTKYTYDSLNRLKSLEHGSASNARSIAFYDYEYDSASRIKAITDIDGRTDYQYDDRDQLTGADRTATDVRGDEAYSYDANGNRISSSLHNGGYITGPGNRLLFDGTYNYTYDNEGNMIRRASIADASYRVFAYDHRNRMTGVTDFSAGGTVTQEVETFYDALGRRIGKTFDANGVSLGGEVTTYFVYNAFDVLLDFIDEDGSGSTHQPELTVRYLFGPGIDRILVQEVVATLQAQWLLTDHLGTVRDIVSNVGTNLNHITYDSYGNVDSQTSSIDTTRYLFTGRERDSETNMYYYRARFYDAAIGRFISSDPIGPAMGDANVFRYAINQPVSRIDRLGLDSRDPNESLGGPPNFSDPEFWEPKGVVHPQTVDPFSPDNPDYRFIQEVINQVADAMGLSLIAIANTMLPNPMTPAVYAALSLKVYQLWSKYRNDPKKLSKAINDVIREEREKSDRRDPQICN